MRKAKAGNETAEGWGVSVGVGGGCGVSVGVSGGLWRVEGVKCNQLIVNWMQEILHLGPEGAFSCICQTIR